MTYMAYTPTIHLNVPKISSQRHYLAKLNPESQITKGNALTTSL